MSCVLFKFLWAKNWTRCKVISLGHYNLCAVFDPHVTRWETICLCNKMLKVRNRWSHWGKPAFAVIKTLSRLQEHKSTFSLCKLWEDENTAARSASAHSHSESLSSRRSRKRLNFFFICGNSLKSSGAGRLPAETPTATTGKQTDIKTGVYVLSCS